MSGDGGRCERLAAASGDARGKSEQRAGDDDKDADPDPGDERVQERLDDGAVGVGVAAFEDDVEVTLGGRVQRDHGRTGFAGVVEALLWG